MASENQNLTELMKSVYIKIRIICSVLLILVSLTVIGLTNPCKFIPYPCSEESICVDQFATYVCLCKAGYEKKGEILYSKGPAVPVCVSNEKMEKNCHGPLAELCQKKQKGFLIRTGK